MAQKQKEKYEVPLKGEEKILAALSHLAIFFLPIILPLLIWLYQEKQKDFSEYVLFQSKQALLYQLGLIVLGFGIGVFVTIFSYFLVGPLFLPTFILLFFLAMLYGAYGGVQCLLGKDFQYFYLGAKIKELRL